MTLAHTSRIEKTKLLQFAELFAIDIKTIGEHIDNALKEELANMATVAKFATVQNEGVREVTRNIESYNLDIIAQVSLLSVRD